MKKQKNLYIYLEDKDQRIFSIEGPIDHDTADDWLDIGNSAVRSGRNLKIIDFWEEDLNGLDAWIGLGIGVIEAESDDEEDLDIFVWILSASQDDKRYVAYLFCALEDAEYYEDLMIYIMASFMPYQEEDE